jgi:hypothetical protein
MIEALRAEDPGVADASAKQGEVVVYVDAYY